MKRMEMDIYKENSNKMGDIVIERKQ